MVACFRCLLVNEQPHGLPRPVGHAVLIFSPGLIPLSVAQTCEIAGSRVTEAVPTFEIPHPHFFDRAFSTFPRPVFATRFDPRRGAPVHGTRTCKRNAEIELFDVTEINRAPVLAVRRTRAGQFRKKTIPYRGSCFSAMQRRRTSRRARPRISRARARARARTIEREQDGRAPNSSGVDLRTAAT